MAETVPLMVRADLCERIKALAAERGQSIDELLEDLLSADSKPTNWALAFADAVESADVEWVNDPDASIKSSERYKQHVYDKWLQTQNQTGKTAADCSETDV